MECDIWKIVKEIGKAIRDWTNLANKTIEQEYTVTNKLTTNYKKHICKRIDTETHFKVFDKYYKIKDGAKIEAEYIRNDKSINDLKKQIFAQIATNSKNLNLKLAEFLLSKEEVKELEKMEINSQLTKEELEDMNNESIKLKTKLQTDI